MLDAAGAKISMDGKGRTAILDHLLHHAVTLKIRGNSYVLKEKLNAGLLRTEEPES